MNKLSISYLTKGEVKSTSLSNEELIITRNEDSNLNSIRVLANQDIELDKVIIESDIKLDRSDFLFLNGYQSWTDTKEFKAKEKEKNLNHIPSFLLKAYGFQYYGDQTFYHYAKKLLHGYDIFYKKGKEELFILNHLYKECYLIIEIDKKAKKLRLIYEYNLTPIKRGETKEVAKYYLSHSIKDGLEHFKTTFTKKNITPLLGYTSWYNHYQAISEDIILKDLEGLDNRYNLFQIDDGYQTHIGDWLDVDKEKFPHGLEGIVKAIHDKGLKAGIWLAPFVAEETSKLFKEHPDYFVRKEDGELQWMGCNWSGFYPLDLDKKEVRDYVKKCLTHYKDMGFDFFKLDFLYASHLVVKKGRSRAKTAEEYYQLLRDCLDDKLILGCGASTFSSIDKFDYLRIGPDVSLLFDDLWYMRLFHRERISTKVTIQNSIYRSLFNDRFYGNDPDVFLLRDENIGLSDKQKEALLTINALTGTVLLTSDNIASYDEAKQKKLEEALELFYHATLIDYERKKHLIRLTYEINGEIKTLTYNTKKGILL